MARTRQQQESAEKQARADATAKRTVSRQWCKPELLTLLTAWRQVLCHAKVRHETSAEFEHRLYERFRALSAAATDVNNNNSSDAVGNGDGKNHALSKSSTRDELAIAQTMQILKRTFRFISEHNQKHHSNRQEAAAGSDGHGSTIRQGRQKQLQQEIIDRSWFELTVEERQEQFMQGQRNRRMNSFMDIDKEMFQGMTAIMTKTIHQFKSKVALNSKSDAVKSDTEQSADDQSWSSAELWSLLHAWRETLEDPNRLRVHSSEFVASLVQRFEDICDGKSQKSETSVRLKKVSLVSLFALIKQYNSRQSRADEDWFTLSPTRRAQKYRELSQKTENYSDLNRGMFSMLTFILKLEDDSNQTSDQQQHMYLKQQQERNKRPQTPVEEQQNEFSNSLEGAIELVLDSEEGYDEDERNADQYDKISEQDDDGEGNRANQSVNGSLERSIRAPETEEDSKYNVRGDDDAGAVAGESVDPECPISKKRQRLDSEMLAVVDILEKEAKHLSAMLHEVKGEREADREERRQLREQLKQDQVARRREQVEWRLEKEQLLHELERLRNQQYGYR